MSHSLGACNDVIAADASLALAGVYLLRGQLGASYVAGAPRSPSAPDAAFGHDSFAGAFSSLDARRHDANLLVELRTEYHGPRFRAETSPLTRVGIRPSFAELTYHHYAGTATVPFVEADLQLSAVHAADRFTLLDGSIRPSLLAHLGNNADRSIFYSRGQETFHRTFTAIDTAGAELTAYPWNKLSFTTRLQGGDQINDNPADLFLGRTLLGDLQATVTPTHNLQFDLGFTRSTLRRPDGQLAADVDLYYAKAALSFTPRLSARLISQLDDSVDVLRNSALVAYVLYPGTETYLGYEEGDASLTTGSPRALDRRLFFKCSYRWQLLAALTITLAAPTAITSVEITPANDSAINLHSATRGKDARSIAVKLSGRPVTQLAIASPPPPRAAATSTASTRSRPTRSSTSSGRSRAAGAMRAATSRTSRSYSAPVPCPLCRCRCTQTSNFRLRVLATSPLWASGGSLVERRVQPRRHSRRHCELGQDRAGLGRGHRQATHQPPQAPGEGGERRVQPRRRPRRHCERGPTCAHLGSPAR